jgi:hypothetical protein
MTATLTFSLPEEQEEFQNASNGTDWRMVAMDMAEWLKRKRDGDLSEAEDSAYQSARDQLFALIEDRGLSLW